MKQIFNYESAYAGPAIPTLNLKLLFGDNIYPEVLTGLIDTGSDTSSIPIDILHSIQAKRTDSMNISTIIGTQIPVDLYLVAVQIGEHRIYGIEVVGNKQTDEIIIGRDILNQLIVELNGLAQVTTISDRVYWPFHTGSRFSANARGTSSASSEANILS